MGVRISPCCHLQQESLPLDTQAIISTLKEFVHEILNTQDMSKIHNVVRYIQAFIRAIPDHESVITLELYPELIKELITLGKYQVSEEYLCWFLAHLGGITADSGDKYRGVALLRETMANSSKIYHPDLIWAQSRLEDLEWENKIKAMKQYPHTGIDELVENREFLIYFENKRIGLIANKSSVNKFGQKTFSVLFDLCSKDLRVVYSPEHGWDADMPPGQDIPNNRNEKRGIDILSLFGELFEANLESLKNLDVLIIDIQDVGVRCYTYAATCAKVIEYISNESLDIEIVICDRPNILGKQVFGPPPSTTFKHLVNYLHVPLQHGKSLGELLSEHNDRLQNPVTLIVLPYREGPTPENYHWIPPSPNLKDRESVFLYPGIVLFQGVNISLGRGTDFPFKCIGKPGLPIDTIIKEFKAHLLPGVLIEPITFSPTEPPFKGERCKGISFKLEAMSPDIGLSLGLRILDLLHKHDPSFEWVLTKEGYWIDILTGSTFLRESISKGVSVDTIEREYATEGV